jgi:hypothetical protein
VNDILKMDILQNTSDLDSDDVLFELFDTLSAVSPEDVLGKWQGGGVETGHWLLSALTEMKWFGKWIISENSVKPLVCTNDDGHLFSSLAMNGEASLRTVDYRGKRSSAVAYDGVPMFGQLRRLDETTLLGVVTGGVLPNGMSVKSDGRHQFFHLRKIEAWPADFVG